MKTVYKFFYPVLCGAFVVGIAGTTVATTISAAKIGSKPASAPSPTPTPNIEKLKKEREALKNEVDALAAKGSCKSVKDCGTFEFGMKPCGGPWSFIAYAKNNPQISNLKSKLATYASVDKRYNEATELMSDCSMTEPPEIECVKRTCKLKEVDPGDSP